MHADQKNTKLLIIKVDLLVNGSYGNARFLLYSADPDQRCISFSPWNEFLMLPLTSVTVLIAFASFAWAEKVDANSLP